MYKLIFNCYNINFDKSFKKFGKIYLLLDTVCYKVIKENYFKILHQLSLVKLQN